MTTPRPNEPDAEHRRAVHKLFEAVYAFAWRALGRYGLPAADRDDIAQNVAIAALRRWPTYREPSGTPGQWLWGIVRNELRVFLRAQGRQPVPASDDLLEVASEAPSPEEGAALHDLADHLLSMLPVEQRRVVLLHEVVGLTYREIAALEGISKSEAHERHRTGMRALTAAAYRGDVRRPQSGRLRGVALLPIALADLAGRASRHMPGPAMPSCDARESAWRRAAAELGAAEPGPAWDAAPQSTPFTTAAVGGSPPVPSPALPSISPPLAGWSWLRRLAPTGVALLGGLVAGVALERGVTIHPPASAMLAQSPPTHLRAASALVDERSPAAASPTRDLPGSPATEEASPGPGSTSPERPAPARAALAPPREPARLRVPATPAPDDNAEALAEQALMDQGRAGLASGKLEQAIAAFSEHARRFPRGAFAGERARLLELACGQRGTTEALLPGCAAPARP